MTFFYVTADIYYREPHQKKEMHVLKSTRENTATLRERERSRLCQTPLQLDTDLC